VRPGRAAGEWPMTPINALNAAIVQGSQVQQRQSTDRQRQIRRVQNLSKNSALQGDTLEHQVESADAVGSVGDGRDSTHPRRRRQRPKANAPVKPEQEPGGGHVDVTA
jgi:hypothetical protein